jgi:hypothetical protein
MKGAAMNISVAIPLLLCATAIAQAPVPRNGYIPDEKTAIRVAEAILSPIYGEQQIKSEQPFHATLANGVWVVEGSLPAKYELGGVASVRIDKKTGAVLSYIHGK